MLRAIATGVIATLTLIAIFIGSMLAAGIPVTLPMLIASTTGAFVGGVITADRTYQPRRR